MTSQLEAMLDGYADSLALRLTRLAAGDREQAQDSLWLAMQADPILRRACREGRGPEAHSERVGPLQGHRENRRSARSSAPRGGTVMKD